MNILSRGYDLVVPLTPHEFYVLLSLAESQNNGYGLMAATAADSNNLINLTPGTVYPLLKRLKAMGYTKTLRPQPGSGPTGTTTIHRITDAGLMVLKCEIDRYARGAELGRVRLRRHARPSFGPKNYPKPF